MNLTDKIQVFNCDNMELMAKYPDKYFDLASIDPQYGINASNMQMGSAPNRKGKGQYAGKSTAVKLKGRLNSGGGKLKNRLLNKSKIDWDNEPPPPEFFTEILRVSKNQIIWGGNYFTDMLPASRCWICWDKMQPWENFSQFELAWTSFDKPAALYRHSNTGGANREVKIHPTQKSVILYNWLLHKYADPSFKVLDTGLGSGSHAISAHYFGCEFVGCENNKDYFNDFLVRFKHETAQLKLF